MGTPSLPETKHLHILGFGLNYWKDEEKTPLGLGIANALCSLIHLPIASNSSSYPHISFVCPMKLQ